MPEEKAGGPPAARDLIIERMRRDREAYADALAIVRQFNVRLDYDASVVLASEKPADLPVIFCSFGTKRTIQPRPRFLLLDEQRTRSAPAPRLIRLLAPRLNCR